MYRTKIHRGLNHHLARPLFLIGALIALVQSAAYSKAAANEFPEQGDAGNLSLIYKGDYRMDEKDSFTIKLETIAPAQMREMWFFDASLRFGVQLCVVTTPLICKDLVFSDGFTFDKSNPTAKIPTPWEATLTGRILFDAISEVMPKKYRKDHSMDGEIQLRFILQQPLPARNIAQSSYDLAVLLAGANAAGSVTTFMIPLSDQNYYGVRAESILQIHRAPPDSPLRLHPKIRERKNGL